MISATYKRTHLSVSNSARRALRHSFPEKQDFQGSSQGLDCGVLKLIIELTGVVSYLTVRVKFVVCANAPEVPVTVMV